jgi:hypothetical protein
MARSRKKTPITGITTTDTEKNDKRLANRKLRVAVRTALAGDGEIMPELREISDVWSFGKDGKRWVGDVDPRNLRK